MSNGVTSVAKSMSQRKQVRSALERIDLLEQELPNIIKAVNDLTENQQKRVVELAQILEAVAELVGGEAIDAKMREIADRKTMQQVERAKAAVTAGVEKGTLVKVSAVTEKSLIVGREIDKDGNVVYPGHVQLNFSDIKPEFQVKLLEQVVGAQIETTNGVKFEVLDIYDVVQKPEEPAPETQPVQEAQN